MSASFTQPRLFSTFSAYHTRPFPLLKVSFYLQYASLCARPYLVYIARLLKSGLPKIQLPSFSPPRQLCHQGTRARYYRKLASLEPEFQPLLSCIDPNTKGQPCDVDRLCADVIPWLRAKTREPTTFRLVYEENINYGYIRNMLRLKPVGLGANIVAIIFFGINIIANISTFTWNEQRAFFLCVAIHLLVVLYLHLCINDSAVNAAAKRYAYALLETIDSL